MAQSRQDQWARWLLERRHGGDAEHYKAVLKALFPIRDKVLQNSRLAEGETLLDVGCGDGLIAFEALSRVGEQGRIVFSDISQDLLDHCRSLAQEMGALNRCQFVQASADKLDTIEDDTVDVVTTRSVLIYVKEKLRAFEEFYRVLKTGGRLSIFEPINRFAYPEPPHLFFGYDVTPIIRLKHKLLTVYAAAQHPRTDAMMDFDERDLLTFAEKAGFTEVHLELQVDIVPGMFEKGETEPSWEAFLRSSPNPLMPTLEEAMQQALTRDEIERFTNHLRPLVEGKGYVRRFAMAYLWAVKH
jgi:arsenite methyltransferase